MAAFHARLDLVPESPGVYLMKDAEGSIIYVGKAINLRQRLRSYFGPHPKGTLKVLLMIEKIADFSFVLCKNELEALVLESSLIKEYQPFYNILLKDDRDYPYLRITLHEAYPRLLKAYRQGADKAQGARYYGPYLHGDLHRALGSLHKIFPLKTCNRVFPRDVGKERPCLQYYIHGCIGPCLGTVSAEDYRAVVQEVCDFLEGRDRLLLEKLQQQMEGEAERLDFEAAAATRDRIEALNTLLQKSQRVTLKDRRSMDVFALFANGSETCLQKLEVRHSRISGTGTFFLDGGQEEQGDLLAAFLRDHYDEAERMPRLLLLSTLPTGVENLLAYLSEIKGQAIQALVPQRGEKKGLLDMALQTAREALERRLRLGLSSAGADRSRGLDLLAEVCGLEKRPERIEAYDISNNANQDIVCAMTVFIDGKASSKDYRSFKIRGQEMADDYQAMREALERRLAKLGDLRFGKRPDLILLDGGKGHVSTIRDLLQEKGYDIPLAGMVKDQKHRTRGLVLASGEVLELSQSPTAEGRAPWQFALREEEEAKVDRRLLLKLLTQIQDETHRRAILLNRTSSQKRQLRYRLESIEGVGPARRKQLLSHFGTIKSIQEASLEDLRAAPGVSDRLAEAIYDHFHGRESR